MALPRGLPSADVFPDDGSNLGPFFVNSAVYILMLDTSGPQTSLVVYKSSDPDSAAFTEQDAGNNPQINTAVGNLNYSISGWLVGSILHIAVASDGIASSSVDLSYFRFDTSADTFSTGHGAWGTVVSAYGGNGDPTVPYCDIRVHTVTSEEWIEISYGGAQARVHGVNYNRVYLATYDPGAGWTVDQVWDNSGATDQKDYHNLGLSVAGDRVHGIVNAEPASGAYGLNTITASGSINLWTATAGSGLAQSVGGWGSGVADGTSVYHFVQPNTTVSGADARMEFTSADSPGTLTANTVRESSLGSSPYRRVGITFDASESDIYCWFTSVGDIEYDLNDGTDTSAGLGATLTAAGDKLYVSPVDYTVSSRNVIGVIYRDGSNLEYDEFSLAAPADEFPVVPHEALQLSAIPVHAF